ncbi:hypothetical protein B9Z19DRAFT_1153938 [Tuber borchii]|uniref:Uncharacterized protein n=1 Tax=Tuber borchii TaxID=42251 RepID=A0A2T6ZIU8_TUBBO|nr:hypothetical protein B9Z19DRAFT_1153938 [Tuber borchii]
MSYFPHAPNYSRDNNNAFNTTGSLNHNADAQNHNINAFNRFKFSYTKNTVVIMNNPSNEIDERLAVETARRIPETLSPPPPEPGFNFTRDHHSPTPGMASGNHRLVRSRRFPQRNIRTDQCTGWPRVEASTDGTEKDLFKEVLEEELAHSWKKLDKAAAGRKYLADFRADMMRELEGAENKREEERQRGDKE